MRAGKLDRTITIERVTRTLDANRVSVDTWTTLTTMRAQIIQASTDDYIKSQGAVSETVAIFRTRWLDGVTLEDRVSYEGQPFRLKQIKELGRRRGLELRCERAGQ